MAYPRIRVRLQVNENGEAKDTYDAYGLIYLSSDNYLAPPTKGFETTTYAEEAGEHCDQRTVDDAFDYTATFLLECPNNDMKNVNAKIEELNNLMYTQDLDSETPDIKTFNTWAFFNDYKKIKIVGRPEQISVPKSFWRDSHGILCDCVQVELKIRVTDPSKCQFNLLENPGRLKNGNGGYLLQENSAYIETE